MSFKTKLMTIVIVLFALSFGSAFGMELPVMSEASEPMYVKLA